MIVSVCREKRGKCPPFLNIVSHLLTFFAVLCDSV